MIGRISDVILVKVVRNHVIVREISSSLFLMIIMNRSISIYRLD